MLSLAKDREMPTYECRQMEKKKCMSSFESKDFQQMRETAFFKKRSHNNIFYLISTNRNSNQ